VTAGVLDAKIFERIARARGAQPGDEGLHVVVRIRRERIGQCVL